MSNIKRWHLQQKLHRAIHSRSSNESHCTSELLAGGNLSYYVESFDKQNYHSSVLQYLISNSPQRPRYKTNLALATGTAVRSASLCPACRTYEIARRS